MSKFIVTVFDDEESAYKVSRAVLDLDNEGSIVSYAGAVISKDRNGVVNIEDAADEGPIGTATGVMLGTLLGGLGGVAALAAGGPAGVVAAGMAGGMAAGGMGRWFADLYNVGVDGEFLEDVANVLTPGKYAVVAEVDEGWTAPLDTKMEQLGGVVFRRNRIDVEDAQIERNIEMTNRELDELEEEWNQSVGEAKDKLTAIVDAARNKLQSLDERRKAKLESLHKEADAKIAKLNEQIEKAEDETKARFEKRRNELKVEFSERTEKLKQAGKLEASALTP